jgi:hypothetical protein
MALKMKPEEKYTSVAMRVSHEMLQAYDKSTGVDLEQENRKFVQSEETINKVLLLIIGSALAMFLFPIPTAFVISWTGMINGASNQFMVAGIMAGATGFCAIAHMIRIASYARKVRDGSQSVLEQFRMDVKSLNFLSQSKFLDQETARGNLTSMAEDVVNAEELEKFLLKSKKLDEVDDIINIKNRVKERKQILEDALSAQKRFGLNFTKRELFPKAKRK